jgi:WD40 repeat protein
LYAVAVGRLGDRDVIVAGDGSFGGGDGGVVRVWDTQGQPIGHPLRGHDGPVAAVAVGRLGDRDVIVAGDDSVVRVWDTQGQPIGHPLRGHDGPVSAVAVGRLGDRDVIVAGDDGGTVRIWPLTDPCMVLDFLQPVASVVLADNLIYVASGPAICVWEPATSAQQV